MNEMIDEYSMEVARFLAESEEKIIARFVEIAGLKKEYDEAMNPNQPLPSIEYAWTNVLRKLHKRGYEIIECHDPRTPIDGVDKGTEWRVVLLHDGKEVAYNTIEVVIGTMRRTGYGMQIR